MQQELINKLCCPACSGRLLINDGSLFCGKCSASYSVIQGRPVLVPNTMSAVKQSELIAAAEALLSFDSVQTWGGGANTNVEDYYFNKLFPVFNKRDRHWAFLGRKVAEMVRAIPAGSEIIDIGAGECKYGALFPGCSYIATDLVFSSDKHDFSRINVIADAAAIPFKEASFDVALNLAVMEHVPDPNLVIHEMARVLRPSGTAYALIPLVRPEHLVPYDFQRFTRYGIQQLFTANGFKIEQIEGSNNALWTAVNYLSLYTKTTPLQKYGRRSIRGIFLNRMWATLLWPLIEYARLYDSSYPGDFPMYYWVRASKMY